MSVSVECSSNEVEGSGQVKSVRKSVDAVLTVLPMAAIAALVEMIR